MKARLKRGVLRPHPHAINGSSQIPHKTYLTGYWFVNLSAIKVQSTVRLRDHVAAMHYTFMRYVLLE